MLGILVSLGVVYSTIDPAAHKWMPQCPVHLLTGWQCPGCGMQRFLHALLHGRVLEAVRYNYWLVLALPYAAVLLTAWLLPDGLTKEKLRCRTENRWAVWFYIVSFFIWFAVRNILHI